MDKYESVRSLPFPSVASALGLDLSRFKHQRGEWHGPCPIHGSQKNNNAFHYQDSTGKFKCFACPDGHGCGAIDLAMKVKNIGFKQAVELLGHIEPPKEEKPQSGANFAKDGQSGKVFDLTKYQKHAAPCDWLEKRCPDAAIRELYGVFFYSNPSRKSAFNNRVLIPVRTIQGDLQGYLGRSIQASDEAKYLFPRGLEKSKYLFGAHELYRQAQTHTDSLPLKVVYVVESPFAVMKFASLGFPAVSPFGWSISHTQSETLASLTKGLLYLPDRNKYNEISATVLQLSRLLWIRCPQLPDGIDDPEYLSLEAIRALC